MASGRNQQGAWKKQRTLGYPSESSNALYLCICEFHTCGHTMISLFSYVCLRGFSIPQSLQTQSSHKVLAALLAPRHPTKHKLDVKYCCIIKYPLEYLSGRTGCTLGGCTGDKGLQQQLKKCHPRQQLQTPCTTNQEKPRIPKFAQMVKVESKVFVK